MAAIAGPTQEASGAMIKVPSSLPPFGAPKTVLGNHPRTLTDKAILPTILEMKIEANAHLPRLAEGYVSGELLVDDICAYFHKYAHLYTVGIDVNANCNLACKYCYLDAYNLGSTKKYETLENFMEFIGQVVAQGVDLVALVGKEPFVDERGIQLLQSLDRLVSRGDRFRYGVVTNGTLIDHFLGRLPRSISYIDISLDGGADINDSVRGRGSFSRAAANIRLLVDSGFPVWISSVLHRGNNDPQLLREFIRILAAEYGCGRFYFSPVRNFTGSLGQYLLSYSEIAEVQSCLMELSETLPGVEMVILDHPYEAVWRDYFWPIREGGASRLESMVVDGFGNVLERLSSHCCKKLDVFPHSPWGTGRIDASGQYLHDVESRTYSKPISMGSIRNRNVIDLHRDTLRTYLRPMMENFLGNMEAAYRMPSNSASLVSVSIPDSRQPLLSQDEVTSCSKM